MGQAVGRRTGRRRIGPRA